MELTAKQQIVELVKSSKNILILTHINPDGDGLGSILALSLVLKKLEKAVTIYSSASVPTYLNYLPQNSDIRDDLNSHKDFIVTIKTDKAKIKRLAYKNLPEDNRVNIVITPTEGNFTIDDVFVGYSSPKFDLIFVLDSPTLERLGDIYEHSADLFYEVPIVNIDHHPGNDYFGKVNWVDLTATSTSEILVSLVESLGRDKNLFDADVATCLLTGIITDTGSFQHSNTTPKSFTVAAQLVAAGARQQEIIKNIYKTKPLSTLKLWGKILSNIKEDREANFVYSVAAKEDFLEFGASESESSGVVDELLKTAPDINFALLLSEKGGGVHGSLRSAKPEVNVSAIAKLFGGGGHEMAAAFMLSDTNLSDSLDKIIAKIHNFQTSQPSTDKVDELDDNEEEQYSEYV
ncbi:MAG: bifunctional oligoribonuclease/PAP phosphatase NrnA [Patescibacteria group bacterium]|nr:bifunctional oligoribonuclease/PAP phosphatase NrnA [Patescibacteria group bacterium]